MSSADVEALLTPPPEPESFLGSVVGHRYRVQRLIGRGGMGAVFEAEHVELGTPVALKVLIAERGVSEVDVERFMREARAAVRIGHQNIVRIFDLGRMEDGTPFMAMERLVGRDLDEILLAEGVLPFDEAMAVLRPIASAIDAVHAEGLVHRDVKPANIFLARDRGRLVPKLLDFGLAQLRDRAVEERLTGTGLIVGTPHYLAPEIALGSVPDGRSDQYSLAVIAYELISGTLPFDGPTPTSILLQKVQRDPPVLQRADTGPASLALRTAMARALDRDPTRRFASCTAMVDALEAANGKTAAGSGPSAQLTPLAEVGAGGARPTDAVGAGGARPTDAVGAGGARPTDAVGAGGARPTDAVGAGGARPTDAPTETGRSEGGAEVPVDSLPTSGRRLLRGAAIVLALALLVGGAIVLGPDRGEGGATADAAEPPAPEPPVEPAVPPEVVAAPPPEVVAAAAPEPAPAAEPATPTRRRRRSTSAEPESVTPTPTAEPAPSTMGEPPAAQRDSARAAELTASAQRAMLRGRLPEAARLFREAAYNDPTHAAAWRGLGITEERLGHGPEAKRAYDRYLRQAPNARDAAAIRQRIEAL